ncbi:MAG TPA: TonB-dependent receptor [Terriglobales bacterium]|nr:TonB-dependent receptor [Terriglobales bacterium]
MSYTYRLLICLLLMSAFAAAQVGTQSSITGTVTDSTGAIVQGAQVVATNVATGATKQVVSGPNGNFDILALPPGVYTVKVNAKGFKIWEDTSLTLTVGNKIRVEPVLQVGSEGQTVTVQSDNTGVQTESSTVETLVQMNQIRELPLDTRNAMSLVALSPGMRITGQNVNGMRITMVQGNGMRDNKTNFQLNGITSNDGSFEGGTAVPNVEAVAEFNVQTLNAGAEAGRQPSQVLVVTKSGTNQFHGALFEFLQNDKFNAYNAFADKTKAKPRVRYNQFGAALGGPIRKDKTFFFGSFQGTTIRNATLLNEAGIPDAFKTGDFSSLSTPIRDPLTGQPFPGNIIPADRISNASKYFLPLFVSPNAASNRYIANATTPDDTWEYLGRIDHQITPSQHIYGHYEYLREPALRVGYLADPDTYGTNTLKQHNLGINYQWTLTNATLFTATGGFMRTRDDYANPALGQQNDSQLAGIQGIPSTGREAWVGPPDIGVTGYQGINFSGGYGVPGAQWNSQYTGKASISHVRGSHSLGAGFEYNDRHTYGGHGSAAARGVFTFNGQYTGNGFADYLLGYTNATSLNDPLVTFGQERAPYVGLYVTDTWRVRQNLTVNLGLRYDRYLQQSCYLDLCASWNPTTNKMVVAADENGNPNFSTFPTTAGLAAETAGLWQTSEDAGYPRGLYRANGNWAPRLGITYRPFSSKDIVLRGGYGIYYNIFTGNRGASLVNLPVWTVYGQTFGASTLQSWETAWAAGPSGAKNFNVYSPLVDIKPTRTHQWNVSVQTALPAKTSLTLSYVGTRVPNEISAFSRNVPTVGFHANIAADRPYPAFNIINTFQNMGEFWYNGLQTYVERRFDSGLSFTFAYAFSRTMIDRVAEGEFDALAAYSPDWYNRHRSINDFRHIQSATVVWQVPYGRGKRFGANANGIFDAILGGWQLSLMEQARSGQPLTMSQSNGNLGNGQSSRLNIIGDPSVADPSKDLWFNTAAFAAAPLYTFGNSGIGDVEGPGFFQVNSGLSKNFKVTEKSFVQFRWEAYNLFNRVNLGNPGQNINSASTFGKIFSASTARYMQFGLRFVF